MNIFIQCLTLSFFLTNTALANETVNFPSDDENWRPYSGMEIGKVKYLSKDNLPSGFKKIAAEEVKKSDKGYEILPEEFFIYSRSYHNRLRLESDIKPKISVTLADISSTELKNYVYEGIIPDGPTINGPWTSVVRVFKRNDGIIVMLREWDYVADGGSIIAIKELMNVTVANKPAMLTVKKSPSSENSITDLDWFTDTKHFTISVFDDVDIKNTAYNRKWLVNLANSIERNKTSIKVGEK